MCLINHTHMSKTVYMYTCCSSFQTTWHFCNIFCFKYIGFYIFLLSLSIGIQCLQSWSFVSYLQFWSPFEIVSLPWDSILFSHCIVSKLKSMSNSDIPYSNIQTQIKFNIQYTWYKCWLIKSRLLQQEK